MKYSTEVRVKLLDMVKQGNSNSFIATYFDVSEATISRWIGKYNLRPIIKEIKANRLSDVIEDSLIELTKGHDSTEITKEYTKIETCPDTGDDIHIKYKVKKVRIAPNVKALQILANKYNKDFGQKDNSNEFNVNILNVDSNAMTLRELQEYGNIIDKANKDKELLESNKSDIELSKEGYKRTDDTNSDVSD